MKEYVIKKLVNIWDPLGVYGLAPEDEYDDMVKNIIFFLETKAKKETIKDYLLAQYYSEVTKNNNKVDELYDILVCL